MTITTTPAEARQAIAVEQVQKIEGERLQLLTRKHEAADSVERLHQEILDRERTGTDLDRAALPTLRQQRLEQQQIVVDIDRVLPIVETDLVPARAELRAATIAIHAEKYNALAEKQRALAEVIDEAIRTIVDTLTAKLALAKQQDDLQSVVGVPNTELSVNLIRVALQQAIAQHLAEGAVSKRLPAFNLSDWSCRSMADGGNLLPVE